MPVILATRGNPNRRTMVQTGLSIRQDPISKITNTEKADKVTEVIEHLPSKCEAFSSTPTTTTKTKTTKQKNCYEIKYKQYYLSAWDRVWHMLSTHQ
jgi:hypothetical protein